MTKYGYTSFCEVRPGQRARLSARRTLYTRSLILPCERERDMTHMVEKLAKGAEVSRLRG